jgi:hypothetical protein
MPLQLVQRLPRSWSLISKSCVRTIFIPPRERSILNDPSRPLVVVLDTEKSVTDRVNTWLAKNWPEREGGVKFSHTSMVLLRNLPANHAQFYERQLEDICTRHAPMILGSARPFVYPWGARNGMEAVGLEYFPSREVQAFFRKVAESFAQKIAIKNQMKTFSNELDGESPMEISTLYVPIITVPVMAVDEAFGALDRAFPFGLNFGVSNGVELIEPVVKNVNYRKFFKFSKGK